MFGKVHSKAYAIIVKNETNGKIQVGIHLRFLSFGAYVLSFKVSQLK